MTNKLHNTQIGITIGTKTVKFHVQNFQLNLALREAVSDIPDVTIFFANLTEIHSFFNRSFLRTNLLNQCQATSTHTNQKGILELKIKSYLLIIMIKESILVTLSMSSVMVRVAEIL